MLKKIALFIALTAMLQGIAFAGAYTSYTDLGTVMTAAGVSYKPSHNVQIYYIHDQDSSPQKYNIGSKNTSGDTIYATSSMAGNIYKWSDTTTAAGIALSGVLTLLPATAGESTGWTGWTAI
jgi:hypothetical protein